MRFPFFFFFFFNDTATTEIYTLSLHDALPIFLVRMETTESLRVVVFESALPETTTRSEEHTSELQSLTNLVCRLLLEKKKPALQRSQHPLTQSSCSQHQADLPSPRGHTAYLLL